MPQNIGFNDILNRSISVLGFLYFNMPGFFAGSFVLKFMQIFSNKNPFRKVEHAKVKKIQIFSLMIQNVFDNDILTTAILVFFFIIITLCFHIFFTLFLKNLVFFCCIFKKIY